MFFFLKKISSKMMFQCFFFLQMDKSITKQNNKNRFKSDTEFIQDWHSISGSLHFFLFNFEYCLYPLKRVFYGYHNFVNCHMWMTGQFQLCSHRWVEIVVSFFLRSNRTFSCRKLFFIRIVFLWFSIFYFYFIMKSNNI